MRSLAARILPRSLYEVASIVKRHRASVRRDLAIKAELDRYTLDPELIRNLKIVPDRDALLREIPKGGVMAEVGVAHGDFTRQILDICQPRKLYLIDLWSADSARYADLMEKVRARFEAEIESGVAEILHGYSWDMLATLPDGSLDFAYVDAAHDFESVEHDLAACEPKMKQGGIIAGHDYTRWSGNGLHRWGVVEAVNEFANRRRWEMRFLTNEPGRHLSFALKRATEAGSA
jgi:predicted O-methyltransferase YrrM